MHKINSMIKPKNITYDSVERIVCEPMSKLARVEMDEDTASIFIGFSIDPNGKEKAAKILDQIWVAEAIAARMEAVFGREMDSRVAIVLATWAGSIGSAVLYMYYCQYVCTKRLHDGELTLDFFTQDIFPMGMFQAEDVNKIWDAQKVDNRREEFADCELEMGSDNLVDYWTATQSLGSTIEA